MDFLQIIMTPFSWLLIQLYNLLFHNYGLALILFALIVKVLLFPFSLKGKRGMIQMNMLSGQQEALKKKYGDNKEKLNEEVQKLYQKEGVNPMGGCLWSFLPILILFPLYAVVRRPIRYLMGLSDTAIASVVSAVSAFAGLGGSAGFAEIETANLFNRPGILGLARATVGADGDKLFAMNFSMLGIDLSAVPQWNFFLSGDWSWAKVGLFLIPIVSALTGLASSIIMQKTSRMNNSAAPQNNTMMILMGPVMSLWIGFTMPAGMGIYWIANNVFTVVQELIAGRMLKEDYAKAAAAREEQAKREKEEEKRIKAERAARIAEERSRPKPKKTERKEAGNEASREGIRAHARGRAYDPNRFDGVTPYRDPSSPKDEVDPEEAESLALPNPSSEEGTPEGAPSAPEGTEVEINEALDADEAAEPAEDASEAEESEKE